MRNQEIVNSNVDSNVDVNVYVLLSKKKFEKYSIFGKLI